MNTINKLLGIESIEDLEKIEKKIKKNKIKKNDFIESNDYEKYESLYNQLISNIIEIRNLSDIDYSQIKISNNINFEIYEIKETELSEMFDFIKKLKDNYDNLFIISLEKSTIEYHELDNNKIITKNLNFIFKQNNKQFFLKKKMKINLGLYILDNNIENVGVFIIKNYFTKRFSYKLEQDNNNIIISQNKYKELKPTEDLIINCNLNINKINKGFHQSKFEIFLFDGEKECDKCTITAFINIIPLIIKFSILNEKFSLFNNIVTISHYFENLEISYSFPGGKYYPKTLRTKLKIDNEKELDINKKKIGKIIITPKFKNKQLNFELIYF